MLSKKESDTIISNNTEFLISLTSLKDFQKKKKQFLLKNLKNN